MGLVVDPVQGVAVVFGKEAQALRVLLFVILVHVVQSVAIILREPACVNLGVLAVNFWKPVSAITGDQELLKAIKKN